MQSSIFKPLSAKFIMLPGQISSFGEFQKEWKAVMGSPEAKKSKEIVYIWTTEKPIPRLKGESNIIYIGKTINTIHQRHFQYGKLEATGTRNKPRYEHILESFGSIKFHIAAYKGFGSDNIKEAEKTLLQAYFDDHFEYPPLNRMGK